jgi:V/A-type H+/Na+-transporting ATPase subunit B
LKTRAFQKVYTKLTQITKATCALKAEGIGYDEMALVQGRPAQVVKLIGDQVTLQVFPGMEGVATNAEVIFLGHPPVLKVSDSAGREILQFIWRTD